MYTTNRGKPTIYTVKPDLKGTSLQQIVVLCCIHVPFKTGLTVYMVGLPRFVLYMYPLRRD
jgi:hypothetical protein